MIEKLRKEIDILNISILKLVNDKIEVTIKKDGTPVTNIDHFVHVELCKILQSIKDIPVVSEEGDKKLYEEYWLVDPIDGTRNLINGGDDFGINIAIIKNKVIEFGLMSYPKKGDTYWAIKNQGSYKNDDKLSPPALNEKLTAVCGRTPLGKRTGGFLHTLKIDDVQRYSAGYKFCLMAEGIADIYPRFYPSQEWDTAPGEILLDELGIKMFSIPTLNKIEYGKTDLMNPHFVAMKSELEGAVRKYFEPN